MADGYKGDSVAKKIARLEFWLRVCELYADKDRSKMKVLVLAGPQSGDVACLLGLGFSPANIVAVDVERDRVEKVRKRFPDVRVYVGDVEAYCRKHEREFDIAFLDWCDPLRPVVFRRTTSCMRAVRSGGLLAVEILNGRDMPSWIKDEIDYMKEQWKLRHEKLAITNKLAGDALTRPMTPFFAKFCEDQLKVAISCAKETWSTARSNAIAWLFDPDMVRRETPIRVTELKYWSVDDASERGKSPMLLQAFYIHRHHKALPKQERLKIAGDAFVRERAVLNGHAPWWFIGKASADELRIVPSAIGFKREVSEQARESGVDKAALLYNVPKTSVCAFLAHYTRGTYGPTSAAS